MKRCRIEGEVLYADGDGMQQVIPRGDCQVETTAQDATVSWIDDGISTVTALPLETYQRYVADGQIVVAA